MAAPKSNDLMSKLVALSKSRGFFFQSSEIYGGLNSCWDYGPLGIELKNNIKRYWWDSLTKQRDDVDGLDASILMHPKVWEASGHVDNFSDPLVDCKKCKNRFRADQLKEEVCPECGGELTEARAFNLMFQTHMGPLADEGSVVYLRPETAQGAYVNFSNVQTSMRRKLPFGICQIGKSFRNEITPGNFIFRTREFEQMELQFYVKPGSEDEWFDKWLEMRRSWHHRILNHRDRLGEHPHGPGELAHYAKRAVDLVYQYPFDEQAQELEGIHSRTDFDLKRHAEVSSKRLDYFDEEEKGRYVPYVVETAVGCDRTVLTVMVDAYKEESLEDGTERNLFSFHPALAPVKAAVLPLVKKDGMPELAQELAQTLRRKGLKTLYDQGGAIGRRYRRQDEIGTPFCLTVDGESLADRSVTVRERDSMAQTRLPLSEVPEWIENRCQFPWDE